MYLKLTDLSLPQFNGCTNKFITSSCKWFVINRDGCKYFRFKIDFRQICERPEGFYRKAEITSYNYSMFEQDIGFNETFLTVLQSFSDYLKGIIGRSCPKTLVITLF